MKQEYILCPVCNQHKFPAWEDNGTCICPNCGWEHDLADEENPFELYGPNDLCLNDYRLRYEYYVEHNSDYHWARDKYPYIPQVEECTCPVCGKFRFEPITWDDIYCGVVPEDIYCLSCGWHYDSNQVKKPDLSNGANAISLNEYKEWYKNKLEKNRNYNYYEEVVENYVPTPHKCPVCGKYEFRDNYCHDICPYCGWEDDGCDEDNGVGANYVSFSEYQKHYEELIEMNPKYKWKESK